MYSGNIITFEALLYYHMKNIITICFCLLAFCSILSGQNEKDFFEDDGFFEDDTSYVATDTIVKGNSFFRIFKGTPGKAALYSLVIPAGGQVYNKSWWKVPLALAIDGSTLYALIYNTRQYNKLHKGYLALLNEGEPYLGYITDAGRVKSARDNANKARQYSYIWFIIGHMVTVFDAFVDNHLQSFDVSDDLSIQFKSDAELGTRFSLVIPLSQSKNKTIDSRYDYTE